MNNIHKARRALVTGASGYIGSKLVARLCADGWDVHVIMREHSDLALLASSREQLTIHTHDGSIECMTKLVGEAKPEIVFHLASLFLSQHHARDISALISSNILFGAQLVEAMAGNGVKLLINTGTSWQHHDGNSYSPTNLYAATKQAFEDVLCYYTEATGLRVATLALFDTYGTDDPRKKLVALLLQAAASQEPLLMSPGEQELDLVYIDDVVDAFVIAAHLLPNQAEQRARYGISSGKPLRLIDLVDIFQTATGCSIPVVWGGRPYRTREVMKTWKEYSKLPGWSPKVDLHDGFRRLAPSILHPKETGMS